VFIGSQVLINPSFPEIEAAIRVEAPELLGQA
jgi:hypothetical protein